MNIDRFLDERALICYLIFAWSIYFLFWTGVHTVVRLDFDSAQSSHPRLAFEHTHDRLICACVFLQDCEQYLGEEEMEGEMEADAVVCLPKTAALSIGDTIDARYIDGLEFEVSHGDLTFWRTQLIPYGWVAKGENWRYGERISVKSWLALALRYALCGVIWLMIVANFIWPTPTPR